MNDSERGPLITFTDAAQLVPGGVHRATISRWATSGVAGVRLAFVRRGGRMFTTVEALAAFLERCHEQRWRGISDGVSYAVEKEMISSTLLKKLKNRVEQASREKSDG